MIVGEVPRSDGDPVPGAGGAVVVRAQYRVGTVEHIRARAWLARRSCYGLAFGALAGRG